MGISTLTSQLLHSTKTCQLAVAGFSLPDQPNFTFFIQDLMLPYGKLENQEYWVFPFQEKTDSPFVRLQPHYVCNENTLPKEVVEKLKLANSHSYWDYAHKKPILSTQERFVNDVEKIKFWIQEGRIEKMMISSVREEEMREDFSIAQVLDSLRRAYPSAYISYISTPYTGTWIGATPEVLLNCIHQHGETVSLAGTQSQLFEQDWGEKEKKEQDIVSRFIEEEMSHVVQGAIQREGPVTITVGELRHLQTRFSFDLCNLPTSEEVFQLALRLHPTPAVGVYPKHALQMLYQAEQHERLYYAGFMGPVCKEEARLFVNLRCMQLIQNKAYIYSGAGITADSDPHAEWIETENKALSIRMAFGR